MLEESSLSAIEQALGEAVTSFVGVRPAFSSAQRSQPETGSLLWQWGQPGPGARLWKKFAYRDTDGAIVIALILRRNGQLSEIELLRGDNRPVASVAPIAQIKEITAPGIIELD
jgi:hypothetical protein